MQLAIKNNKQLIAIFSFVLVSLILCYTIAINSFKDGKFTCNKYILNTYLYIILTFNLLIIINLVLEHFNALNKMGFSMLMLVGIMFLTIGTIFLLHSIDPEKVFLKHFVWLVFVLLISITIHPLYATSAKNIVISSLMTTLGLVFVLSAIAYAKPELISLSWGPVLFFALLGVIIMELILMFVFRNKMGQNRGIFRAISYLVIFIFMGFILYDTKRLQINAKECVKADYIKESLKLFLDILNIFVRILSLRQR
jgi:FtsH-binding integral membrane protein